MNKTAHTNYSVATSGSILGPMPGLQEQHSCWLPGKLPGLMMTLAAMKVNPDELDVITYLT
jgi:hypothetical protein